MLPSWQAAEVTLSPPACGEDLEAAARFGIQIAMARDETAWQLVRSADRMQLCAPIAAGGLRLDLEARRGALAQRLRTARRDDALPRAIGLPRREQPPTVLDATAGLGRDAMVLARLGCTVLAVERVPALAFLVHDAVRTTSFAARLTVVCGDALAQMAACEPAPDVVYLDPMFEHSSSAQVKKDMQVCRLLAGPAADAAALLAGARRLARQRVVVKRHAQTPSIADDISFAVGGERVRFDVYLTS